MYEKVYVTWESYAHLVSLLPDDLKQGHPKMHDAAVRNTCELGWDADLSHKEI